MILTIDTSARQFGIALLRPSGTSLAHVLVPKGKGHSGRLMAALDFLLKASDVTIQDITCIAAATGPGSFTGLRVGLSLAKGLAHALNLPVIGVSTLEALADAAPLTPLPVAPVLYARKNEIFTALFTWNEAQLLVRKHKDTCIRWADLPQFFPHPTLFIGNDFDTQAPLIQSELNHKAHLAPPHHWNINPIAVAAVALRRLRTGDAEGPSMLTPVYLRPPDIRPNPFPLRRHPPE